MQPKPVIVQKYGGSSVADVARIRQVAARVVASVQAGHRVVVVVSAMGNTTNELLSLAREISPRPGRRELDLLVSVGERVSMTLLAMAIEELGLPAASFTGSQSGIITDEQHVAAQVIEVRPHRVRRALDEGKVELPPGAAEGIRSQYAAGVSATDALLGELLTMLEPIGPNAFIAVFSDHGELLGEEGWLHHGSHPAVLDIPLAARWPAGGPAGLVSQTPVSLVDLFPTVLEVAGLSREGRPGLQQLIDGPATRRIEAMGATRGGQRMVYITREGSPAGLERGEDGVWRPAPAD